MMQACSGGGSAARPAPGLSAITVVPTPGGVPAGAHYGAVKITMQIATKALGAKARGPQYLPSSTTTAFVCVMPTNAGYTISVPSCPILSGVRTCTMTVTAPLGSDTFYVQAQDSTGYTLSATSLTTTINNAQNVVAVATNAIPAQFYVTQNTPGTDGCPTVGTASNGTFNYTTYDADANLIPAGPIGATYQIWNDGANASSYSSSSSGVNVSVTSSIPLASAAGNAAGANQITTSYNGSGNDVTTFETVGLSAFSFASGTGAQVEGKTLGSTFNVTPIATPGPRVFTSPHYVFVGDSGNGAIDVWDVCKRTRPLPGAAPAPDTTMGSLPGSLQGPVVLDTNTKHFFQLYANGVVGFYDYSSLPSSGPSLIGSTQTITEGAPQSAAFVANGSTAGYLYVTTQSANDLIQLQETETGGLQGGYGVTSVGFNNPAGVVIANGNVYVANSGGSTVTVLPHPALAPTPVPLTVGSSPSLVAATIDGAYVAVAGSTTAVSIINTTTVAVQTTITTQGTPVGISFTPPNTGSGACATGSTSGVLAVLESGKIEFFNGSTLTAGGTIATGNACATYTGSLLNSAVAIDASSKVVKAVYITGVDPGGTNTTLQAPGQAWRAINRGNGNHMYTRLLPFSGFAASITASY